MGCQEQFVERIQRIGYSRYLHEDIGAVRIGFHHFCMPLICPSTVLRRVSSFFCSAGVRSVRQQASSVSIPTICFVSFASISFPSLLFVLSPILTAESKIFFLIILYPPGVYLSIKKLNIRNKSENLSALCFAVHLPEKKYFYGFFSVLHPVSPIL